MVTNSKILVAGGSGFIGSNLISELILKGNEVVCLSKNHIKFEKRIKNVNYIEHDLRHPIKKNELKNFSDIEYIINCSGYINHNHFQMDGKDIFSNHFEIIHNLIDLALILKPVSFIQIGSSDEYGKRNSPIKESVREEPLSPYALGKLASTHYLRQCYLKGILNTVVLRPFLVFGERQNKQRFLPYLIENCKNDREFKVTKGEQIRDYLYIKDFNKALIKCLKNKNAYGEIINIGSGIPISIKEVILEVQALIGKGKPIFGGISYREGESMDLYANIEKAKRLLNWSPKHDFKKSLEKVINWYSNND